MHVNKVKILNDKPTIFKGPLIHELTINFHSKTLLCQLKVLSTNTHYLLGNPRTHTHSGYTGTFYYVNYWTVLRVGIPRGRRRLMLRKITFFSQELFLQSSSDKPVLSNKQDWREISNATYSLVRLKDRPFPIVKDPNSTLVLQFFLWSKVLAVASVFFVLCRALATVAYQFKTSIKLSVFQPSWWSETPRMHPSGSRNPCSHVCIGELKYTVVRSICITSGGTPGLCLQNSGVPGNPG